MLMTLPPKFINERLAISRFFTAIPADTASKWVSFAGFFLFGLSRLLHDHLFLDIPRRFFLEANARERGSVSVEYHLQGLLIGT